MDIWIKALFVSGNINEECITTSSNNIIYLIQNEIQAQGRTTLYSVTVILTEKSEITNVWLLIGWTERRKCSPPNSDMDYRVFNMRTFLCVHIHTGVGQTDESAQHWLGKTLTSFSCAPDGTRTSGNGIHWILRPTLYQLSHHVPHWCLSYFSSVLLLSLNCFVTFRNFDLIDEYISFSIILFDFAVSDVLSHTSFVVLLLSRNCNI